MNKQLTINLPFGFTLNIQLRKQNARTRKEDFAPIIIDETKKAETLASLDIDSIRARAKAMRAIHAEN